MTRVDQTQVVRRLMRAPSRPRTRVPVTNLVTRSHTDCPDGRTGAVGPDWG